MNFCCKVLKTLKVIRKTVRPILNVALPPLISKLTGFPLKSHQVKTIFLWIELRFLLEILYDVFWYIGLFSPKISRGNIKNEKVIKKIQNKKGEVFFYIPFKLKKNWFKAAFAQNWTELNETPIWTLWNSSWNGLVGWKWHRNIYSSINCKTSMKGSIRGKRASRKAPYHLINSLGGWYLWWMVTQNMCMLKKIEKTY